MRYLSQVMILLLAASAGMLFSPVGKNIHEAFYDFRSGQQPVITKAQIDATLQSLPAIQYEQLPHVYLSDTESNQAIFQKKLSRKTYRIVRGADIFRYVVGGFRIYEFMPKDDYMRNTLNGFRKEKELYLLLDVELLYATLDLLRTLYESGYDETQLFVNAGFRYPRYNANIGGASQSRHIQGQAVDMNIGDINMDGHTTQEDKRIVLDILEKKVIGDKGGIGRYPGTMAIHYDVRGYRARWDSH